MDHAGPEIPVDSDSKTEMLVPNCTGAYGAKAFFLPSRLIGAVHQKMIPLFDSLGPKLNFFSLTVCRLEQYLQNGAGKTVSLP